MMKNFKWLLLVSLTFVACNNDDAVTTVSNSSDGLPLTAGTADFSKFVALGDSFAAGFSDNALFKTGQAGAYTNIMAQQFALVGGGDFKIPYTKDDIGGFSMGGNQIPQFPTRLYFNGAAPVNVSGVTTTAITDHLTGSYNNLGIPGAKSFHLTYSGYASANPYFGRFASSTTATVLGDALAQTPTFFSLWIGGNDVLGYATNGGVPTSQDATLGNDITPPTTFEAVYTGMVTQLTAGGRKGVVANLPYVNTLPYFTTVPYNPLPLDASTIALLMNTTTGYGKYNGGIQYVLSLGLISPAEAAKRTIAFHPGNGNAVVIEDSYLTPLTAYGIPSYRQATSDDLVVLPARNFIGTTIGGNPLYVNGVSVPLADKWVLSKEEIDEVRTATDAYNVTIQNNATTNGLAFVDTKVIMNQLISGGIVANSFLVTSAYVTGGAFSLDGVHPSPRGYALIANKFIEAINKKYSSNLKGVSLADYRILYPASL
ncbi:SGNH/GDSL hydrolase family protein [Flavobacterium psychrotolerans]|uniref:G-D-S-L family lipolytic protein n=1 Tax=Flavobacterium psychrotolerans TaxID=2169410 RepID=A0A2U1JJ73_9FLAO|nr:G-D-S-L family lipolytic protein [Flavobacterium psychrotolerans]PWA05220.1 G-D-S-L family lipolytic protein [Flavobacterium psychrotolerans]